MLLAKDEKTASYSSYLASLLCITVVMIPVIDFAAVVRDQASFSNSIKIPPRFYAVGARLDRLSADSHQVDFCLKVSWQLHGRTRPDANKP